MASDCLVCNDCSLALSAAMLASVRAPIPPVSELLSDEVKLLNPVIWLLTEPR